jgi:hypothetical protein
VSVATQSNSQLIAAYLDAVLRKDASVVERFFAPDVEVHGQWDARSRPGWSAAADLRRLPRRASVARPPSRPGGGQRIFGTHAWQLGGHCVWPARGHLRRNKAAAFGWFRLHALSTGRTVDISYSIRFELCDGLIVKYHFLENTFDVATALRSAGNWLLETDGTKHSGPAKPDGAEKASMPKR